MLRCALTSGPGSHLQICPLRQAKFNEKIDNLDGYCLEVYEFPVRLWEISDDERLFQGNIQANILASFWKTNLPQTWVDQTVCIGMICFYSIMQNRIWLITQLYSTIDEVAY